MEERVISDGDTGMVSPVFEGGVCVMGLGDLRRSMGWGDWRGKLPVTRPREHWEVLEEIGLVLREVVGVIEALEVGEWEIRCDQGMALQVGWRDKERECPLENYLFQRLVGIVGIRWDGDNRQGMGVVVGYSDKGILVGYGSRVWVCNNQNIYGDRVLSTYGDNRRSWGEILENLREWFGVMLKELRLEVEYRENLEGMRCNWGDVEILVGRMLLGAVGQYEGMGGDDVMGITQVSDFVRSFYNFIGSGGACNLAISMWDFLNVGTNVLRIEGIGRIEGGKDIRRVYYFCDLVREYVREREGLGSAEGEIKEPQ